MLSQARLTEMALHLDANVLPDFAPYTIGADEEFALDLSVAIRGHS